MHSEQLDNFFQFPMPLWNVELADELIRWSWQQMENSSVGNNDLEYNTSDILMRRRLRSCRGEEIAQGVHLEEPDIINLSSFYNEHGLDPIGKKDIQSIEAISQLRAAFHFLDSIPACGQFVCRLAKRIQVLRQLQPEYDTSYSHPSIPFTIFVSVGKKHSEIDVIRLAESILHETMHLYLTLIEQISPMVADNRIHFYSPWRDEMRPVRGVLHGIFVFRAILDFYKSAQPQTKDCAADDFIGWRIEEIHAELNQLSGFPSNAALTSNGASLVKNLLP